MLPGLGYWDTAEFQTIPYSFDIAHPTGYPTYIILARIFLYIFPFGQIAWRLNLLAILCMLGSLLLIHLIIKIITKNNLVGLIIIPILGLYNRLFWKMSLQADPHPLHLLFMCAVFYLLIRSIKFTEINSLLLSSLLTGLSIGNHLLTIFIIPALIFTLIILYKKIPNPKISFMKKFIILFVIGLSVYGLIILLGKIEPPLTTEYQLSSISRIIHHVAGSDFQGLMQQWAQGTAQETVVYFEKILLGNFPLWFLILALIGLAILSITNYKIAFVLFITGLFTTLFSLRYQNAALERYFLVCFALITIFASVSVSWLARKFNKSIIYLLISSLVLFSIQATFLNNWRKNNLSTNHSAYQYASSALDQVKSEDYILTWWSYATPLWYLQKVENIKPTVQIINLGKERWDEVIRSKLFTDKNIFLTETFIIPSKSPYYLEKNQNLYKVIKAPRF